MLGDGNQQKVEEEALVFGRLAAGKQKVEVVGEADPAHQIARQVAAAHLDAVRMRLANGRYGRPRFADLHLCSLAGQSGAAPYPAAGRC